MFKYIQNNSKLATLILMRYVAKAMCYFNFASHDFIIQQTLNEVVPII